MDFKHKNYLKTTDDGITKGKDIINNNFNENPWVVTFSPEDTMEDKLKKAAHVKPSKAQLDWMEKEYIAYIHFGPNTFSGRQWGTGHEDPAVYAPTDLDPTQWARVCAGAGMKMAIFTMKHHDGFCQWLTQTTDHSVVNSPIKKDVVKLFRKGCDANNIGFGVYLSPWDMNQRDRALWNTEEYNKYFLAQLEELLTHYGVVDEVWFDGACADYEIWKAVPSYKPDTWYDYIESVQPSAVIRLYDPYFFATEEKWKAIKSGKAKLEWSGKAVRWVGNESANGSVLYIGNKLCVDNDEPHEIKAVERKIELKSGYYPIKVLYTSFRLKGMLKVSWSGPGFEMKEIEAENLCSKI